MQEYWSGLPFLSPKGNEPTHWKRARWWERLKSGGEGEDRGWDSWMDHWLYRHEVE